VLVCGERLRGDDGAAVRAAETLPAFVLALAEVRPIGQLSVEAVLEVPAGAAVIVADAATGAPAGATIELPLERVARADGAAPASSHSLPPSQVLALAAELRGSLPRGVFVGIGGSDFALGERLSPAVEAGLPAYVEALAAEIRRLAAEGDATAEGDAAAGADAAADGDPAEAGNDDPG
jgi:hydrogenase maturation protease